MERYRKYKDSGVDWIGEIPEGWSTVMGGAIFADSKERGLPDDEVLSSTQSKGVIPKCLLESVVQNAEDADLSSFKKVRINDGIISLRSFQGGIEFASQYEGKITPAYTVLRPRRHECIAYLKYLLKDEKYVAMLDASTSGIRQGKTIRYQDFKIIRIPYPSIFEQQAIADYLDEKTGAIDEAVARIERSIELLNEYRRSVISEAVTKGLDPTVPMKDSGIDWIGQIPAHWQLLPLKRLVAFLPGYAFKSDDFIQTPGAGVVRLLRGINVGVGFIRWEDAVYVRQQVVEKLDEYQLSSGDILVGLDRPWIQSGMRVAQVDAQSVGSYLVQRVAKVIARNDILFPAFLIYLFRTNIFAEAMDSTTTGVSVPHISTGQLGEVLVPCPPISEQRFISEMLDNKAQALDSLVAEKQSMLVRLKEYRSALISECVTGKVRVPGVEE